MRVGVRISDAGGDGPCGLRQRRGRRASRLPFARTPVQHNSLKVCNQQADAKKLSGATRTQFIKHCQSETVSAHAPTASLTPAAQATR